MTKNKFNKYFAAVRYLDSLSNLPQPDYMVASRGRSLFLRRFEYFLNLIGNPQRGLKYIHVGGTSGKGSVAMMIHSILTAAGYTAGVYTSPYSTTPIEKIKVNDKLIAPAEFAAILDRLKPAIDRAYQQSPYGRPSWFEIYTAMALVYFKQKKCDYVVLEVGLGGRYDATNIIPRPKVTVINTIGFDHVKQLGNTIEKITTEKAGIIKSNTICLTPSTNPPAARAIIQATCKKVGARYRVVTPPSKPYRLKLVGPSQQHNAEIAAQAATILHINPKTIITGLRKAKLPCRWEIVAKKPLVILDGAHNQSKIDSVVKNLKNLTRSSGSRSTLNNTKGLTYKKLYLIIALTQERNGGMVFKNLTPLADQVLVTRYQNSTRTCHPPKVLATNIPTKRPPKIFLDSADALDYALQRARPNDLVLVTGSFYLTGELRKYWHNEEKILRQRAI